MRAAQQQAQTAGQTAAATGQQLMGQGQQLWGPLTGQLTQQMQSGLTPQQMNQMLVAGQQEAGGALSGIQGQAELQGMRARNAGNLGMALDAAARAKMAQGTQTALGVQNEALRRQMQAEQLGANVMDKQFQAALEAQGLVPKDVEAAARAGSTGWVQNLATLGAMVRGL